jgi:hypothetical protein
MTEKRPTLRDRIRAVRGRAYSAMGRYDQALADLNRAIELPGLQPQRQLPLLHTQMRLLHPSLLSSSRILSTHRGIALTA